jgi:hypothetical protein
VEEVVVQHQLLLAEQVALVGVVMVVIQVSLVEMELQIQVLAGVEH